MASDVRPTDGARSPRKWPELAKNLTKKEPEFLEGPLSWLEFFKLEPCAKLKIAG